MTRRIISIAVIAAIAVALAGCSTFGIDPEQVLSDAAMTTAIKSRLAKDERLSTLTDIGVSTTDDMVTVRGTVADETERQRIDGDRPADRRRQQVRGRASRGRLAVRGASEPGRSETVGAELLRHPTSPSKCSRASAASASTSSW